MLEIVKYTPKSFDLLQRGLAAVSDNYPLRFRSFVDYYYASSAYAELFLAIDNGAVAGFQGVEWMPFLADGRQLKIGFGSNFHSFHPGAGAYLWANFHRSCDAAVLFGGSDDMIRMLRRLNWSFFPEVRTLGLNRRFRTRKNEHWLRHLAKKLIKHPPLRKPLVALSRRVDDPAVTATEVDRIEAGLLDFTSAFRFRFAPGLDYLNWRYGHQVPFQRHRTFAIRHRGQPAGFVMLADETGEIIVSHADGPDPRVLAIGIVKALTAMAIGPQDRREVDLATSHPAMIQLFEQAGFRHRVDWDRPFGLGRMRSGFEPPVPVSEWMVSLGWGDNAARPPFRGTGGRPVEQTSAGTTV